MNKLTIFFIDTYATQPDKVQTTDIRTTANTEKTVPKFQLIYQHTAYRLSLESDRERLGERLLERDLLCERLRGERDLEQ